MQRSILGVVKIFISDLLIDTVFESSENNYFGSFVF